MGWTRQLLAISTRSLSVALDPDALLDKAQRQTGLSNFGSAAFHKPFEILLQSLREEARLSARGIFIMNRTMLRLLTNRLRTEQVFAENPTLTDVPIRRPLYIIGFPRTGTTLLHNLLACDPVARWLHLWEGLYPAPSPQSLETDPRITEVAEWVTGFEKVAPRLAAAHKLAPRGPEECLWLIEHTFNDLIFELRAHVPTYSRWLAEHEADVDIHQYYLRQLQMLGAHCNGAHWVFKAPRHLPGLKGLLAVFPEARIVQTHRDPATVLPSLCSLCEILRGAVSDAVDKPTIGAHWHARLKAIFEQATAVRSTAAEGQILDIQYADLVTDPIATVQHIYAHHGYEFTEPFEAAMRQWLVANRQHKHGAHRYTLEEYGLSEAQVREDFSDYAKEFGL
tara:strand:- start:158 stop:1342 length:1185 start_codon:yes stop_codon:yes gene_type:complete